MPSKNLWRGAQERRNVILEVELKTMLRNSGVIVNDKNVTTSLDRVVWGLPQTDSKVQDLEGLVFMIKKTLDKFKTNTLLEIDLAEQMGMYIVTFFL
jgi:hypothetical protein